MKYEEIEMKMKGRKRKRKKKEEEIVLRIIEDILCWSCRDRKVEERNIKKDRKEKEEGGVRKMQR